MPRHKNLAGIVDEANYDEYGDYGDDYGEEEVEERRRQ